MFYVNSSKQYHEFPTNKKTKILSITGFKDSNFEIQNVSLLLVALKAFAKLKLNQCGRL